MSERDHERAAVVAASMTEAQKRCVLAFQDGYHWEADMIGITVEDLKLAKPVYSRARKDFGHKLNRRGVAVRDCLKGRP